MKPSRYNHAAPIGEGDVVVYNALSGAMARLSQAQYCRGLEAAPVAAGPGEAPDELDELALRLMEAGFLVPDAADEVALACHVLDINRYMAHEVNLVVVPTLDCNMACGYCFMRRDGRARMTDDVARRMVDFAARRARVARHLKVEWFGGEPLLELERMESLSHGLQDICDDARCRLSHYLVTNGYLLTHDVVRRLHRLGVAQVQVTLDGGAGTHDARRPLVGGAPTFARIWDNALACARVIPTWVRVNVSPETYAQAWELYDRLTDVGFTAAGRVYFALTHERDALSYHECAPTFSGLPYARRLFADARDRLARGDALAGLELPFPHLNTGCLARQPLGVAVGPDGGLYKCGKLVGRREYLVGSLFDAGPAAALVPGAIAWVRLQGALPRRCRDCSLLPVCRGGCAAELMQSRRMQCRAFKDFFPEVVSTMAMVAEARRGGAP